MLNKIKNNQHGSTLLVLSMMVLAFILIMALGASAIVRNGLLMGRNQVESTKAFFAAEAGSERILWEVWQGGIVPGDGVAGDYCDTNPADFCFGGDPGIVSSCDALGSCAIDNQTLTGSEAQYAVSFFYEAGTTATTTLTSMGSFKGINSRVIKLIYTD